MKRAHPGFPTRNRNTVIRPPGLGRTRSPQTGVLAWTVPDTSFDPAGNTLLYTLPNFVVKRRFPSVQALFRPLTMQNRCEQNDASRPSSG